MLSELTCWDMTYFSIPGVPVINVTIIFIFFIVKSLAKPLSLELMCNDRFFRNSSSSYYCSNLVGCNSWNSVESNVVSLVLYRGGNHDFNLSEKNEINNSTSDANNNENMMNNSDEKSVKYVMNNITISKSKIHLFKSLQNLFSSFSFKGIGLTVSKSIVELSTIGCGIKLPITPNFPNYDSIVHLPRVGLYVGINYPNWAARFNISISLPIQTIIYLLVILLSPFFETYTEPLSTIQTNRGHSSKLSMKVKDNNQKLKKYSLLDSLKTLKKKLKATDSVRRIGITLSYKYDRFNGLSYSIGPWIYYLPGMRIMNKILPYIMFPPTLLITIVALVSRISSSIQSNFKKHTSVNNKISLNDYNSSISSLQTDQMSSSLDVRSQSTSDIDQRSTLPINFYDLMLKDCSGVYEYWRKTVGDWTSTKSTGFAYNLGWYRSAYAHLATTSAMGSNVQFEVSPFYPFYDLFFFNPSAVNTSLSIPTKDLMNVDSSTNLFHLNSNNNSSALLAR